MPKLYHFKRYVTGWLLLATGGFSLAVSIALYVDQSARELNSSVHVIQAVADLVAKESLSINLGRGNIVFVEDALQQMSTKLPISYAYVTDATGVIQASSHGLPVNIPCCYPWESNLSRRDASLDAPLLFNASEGYDSALGVTVRKGEQFILVRAPILEHSSFRPLGVLNLAIPKGLLLAEVQRRAIWSAGLLFVLSLFLGLTAASAISNQIASPIETLVKIFDSPTAPMAGHGLANEIRARLDLFSIVELRRLVESLANLHDTIASQQLKIQDSQIAESLAILASQVSHDIRSPLSSLQAAIYNVEGLNEQSRIQVRTAVNRIKDIANELLVKNRKNRIPVNLDASSLHTSYSEKQIETKSVELLYALIDSGVSQKRLQYFDRKDVDILFVPARNSVCLFAKILPDVFDRLLSNLINNSVEAFRHGGTVEVCLARVNDRAIVQIKDNGKGISPALLPKVIERGGTFGKIDGNGLGLSHAKAAVESWGGVFKIESIEGRGTVITMELVVAGAPVWFASDITIRPETNVVIIDDDPSIHQLWNSRFAGIVSKDRRIHLYSPREGLDWYRNNLHVSDVLLLCDHEFMGQSQTGINFIEMTGVASKAILITSHWDESAVRERSEKLGFRLLPKALVGVVAILT